MFFACFAAVLRTMYIRLEVFSSSIVNRVKPVHASAFSRHVKFDSQVNVMTTNVFLLKFTRNHFSLHRHPAMSLVVKTRLTIPEDFLVLLLAQDFPGSKWRFSEPDLLKIFSFPSEIGFFLMFTILER